MRRVAAFGDGWHPTSRMPVSEMADKMARIRANARAQGRDADAIALTLRWNAFPDLEAAENRRAVLQRLREYQDVGVEHICIDFNIPAPVSLDFMRERMERLMKEIVPAL
jgi:alkanesulfonate monooxygenase SsuD/methylene tetrahydromethanopterin reductase-like flavin-dependent oxidoreductase (luciferase family)